MKKLIFIYLFFAFSKVLCQDLQIENDLREEEFWDDKVKSFGIKSLEIRSYGPNESMDTKGIPYRLYVYNSLGQKEKSYYFNPDSSIKYQMTYIYNKKNILDKIKVIYGDTNIKVNKIKLNEKGMLTSFRISHPLDGYSSVKYEYTPDGKMKNIHLKLFSHYVNYNGLYRSRRMYGYVPDKDEGTMVERIEVEFIYLTKGTEKSSGVISSSANKEFEICYTDTNGNIIDRMFYIDGKCIPSHNMTYNEKGFTTENILSVNNKPMRKYKFKYL